MPNDYFQFKQFLIKQDQCAMKVCTDACLFGAWVAEKVSGFKFPVSGCLDVGAGTGLLSLMFTQKSLDALIDAVDIDEAAAMQARDNFMLSPWKERLNAYHDSIQNFSASTQKKYDVIICNPPFYENDLKSLNTQRNVALHSDKLLLEELAAVVDALLNVNGSFFVLFPYYRTDYFESLLMKYELFIKEKAFIRQTLKHDYFRTIVRVERKAGDYVQSEIIIMNAENKYSDKFTELLKDYYLKLL